MIVRTFLTVIALILLSPVTSTWGQTPLSGARGLTPGPSTYGVGELVSVEVRRGARTLTAKVPVGERPNDAGLLEALIGAQQVIRSIGIVAIDVTPQIADLLPALRRDKAAVAASVTPETPYSQQGKFEAGDAIYAVNGKSIASVAELQAALAVLKPGAAAVLQIERDSTLMFIAFRMERR